MARQGGGYALQGYGEVYVRHIAGSYSNVVGLPLAETRVLLKSGRLSDCLSGWSNAGSARPARRWSTMARSSKRGSSSTASFPQEASSPRASPMSAATDATRSPSPSGTEYLLPRGAPGSAEGATLTIEVTREPIPGAEPWKRPLARVSDTSAAAARPLAERLGSTALAFPGPRDALGEAGWD